MKISMYRSINYDPVNGRRMKKITAGAAQDSILGVLKYLVLHMELPQFGHLIGYANDIVAIEDSTKSEEG